MVGKRTAETPAQNGRLYLLLVGPPGAGKGSLAGIFDSFKIEHVSSGAIFRDEVKRKTPFGTTFEKALKEGKFIPDEPTLAVMRRWFFARKSRKGFVLDGFPRNLLQARVLGEWMETARQVLSGCLFLDISEEDAVKRISERRSCPADGTVYHLSFHPPKKTGVCDQCGGPLIQRPDDTRETVLHRWDLFERNTRPMLDYYREQGLLFRIDATRSLEEVSRDARSLLTNLISDDSDQEAR